MATFNTTGIDDVIKAMNYEAERVVRNGPAAAQAGADAAITAMNGTVPVRSGGLSAHITKKGPFHSVANGHYCDVFPSGKDKHGERYETIGFVLEFGRSNMPARPWMRTAVETGADAIAQAMIEKLAQD